MVPRESRKADLTWYFFAFEDVHRSDATTLRPTAVQHVPWPVLTRYLPACITILYFSVKHIVDSLRNLFIEFSAASYPKIAGGG